MRRAVRPACLLFLLAALVVAPGFGAACTRAQAICEGIAVSDDRPAPPLAGTALRGESGIDLASFRGRTVVVNFWASWCGPCRAEAPVLAAAARELTPTGVAFLGVDIRDDRAAAIAFEEEFGISYDSVIDRDAAIAGAWGVAAPPATVVVDAGGRVRARVAGPVDRAGLDCMLAGAGQRA